MALKLETGTYYGVNLKTSEAGGFRLRETAYPVGLKTPLHSHADAFLRITLAGMFTETCENRTRTCLPWTLAFHPPGEVHWNHFLEPSVRLLHVEIPSARFDAIRGDYAVLATSADFCGGKSGWLAARLYREFLGVDDLSPLAIEGLLFELLVETSREDAKHRKGPGGRAPGWLRQARDLVQSRFAEHLTLADVAETVGVSPVHLAREFQRFFHTTIGQQIRELRIDYACREIEKFNRSLAEVALAAGFSDQSHFSNTFKNITGMTPCQYQAVCRAR